MDRTMHLAISLDIAAANGHDILDFGQISAFVQKAEAAGVDMVIISDSADEPSTSPFEATTLIAALSTVTEKIGLVASASTLMHQPYNLARRFASLDIISHGRVGWNATLRQNPREAANFSRSEGFSDDDFRRRAKEFINIVRLLWVSWEHDALLFDKASGRFHDPDRMHPMNFTGEFFSVRGPLNVARSPQDVPVLVMSGLPETELDFASRRVDAVLLDKREPSDAKATSDEIKRRAHEAGRDPTTIKVLAMADARPEYDGRHLEKLCLSSGSDGIVLNVQPRAAALEDFVERLLPDLERHGFAKAKPGKTLRDRLGLSEDRKP
ncbi:LLM class flavin-dependent oxidoreductase [Mesorhizobium sp. M2D.F.Ca.ET.185.01.1.1]|uniref:LLM class flavin-dependent oxidoreductase n=2 Tax=Mesorhizobium TaxID=68287 RepID=UPI000FC9F7AE|nr:MULTISPECIES: LLM class flavin-dependent oxidoreductase [unclassified Mesorhizobium]TGP82215.1 LLM class flavin-dependent oxidoreductase [bacterium M00.F.Ca.ET.227.01.1.1]TGP91901.1 LLM class flavin-dependent oxidoreductase [bacterium M00.F.Ca.ET.221.01.1.1]TGP95313.1 LLM class flavin-dependent oxidoreductase [bacterium M00.F.Ca.ET.222.01.1.1]TGT71433.1 LLM class flavin-dependent oxidoreductase [bacterium M00.F.Ca.ET.159.01.1.1]TGT83610.1 LLM class flavin-dependent oxidoreductase [bacterium